MVRFRAPVGVTLRLRLVLALVGLVTVAQVGFVVATDIAYRGAQLHDLENQLRSVEPLVDGVLDHYADPDGTGGSGPPVPPAGGGGGPAVVVPTGTFAELRGAGSVVRSHIQFSADSSEPELPAHLPTATPSGRFFTVPGTGGGTFVVDERRAADGDTVLVAFPTGGVEAAVRRLVLVEAAAIGGLLLVVWAGAWLILRRGLRPLERMAATARRISGGDLSQRVAPSGGPGEVGQLGLALNSMLSDIEAAFAAQAASESRLRQFLADASHELRTPLTSIQGFAELSRVGGPALVDQATVMRRIEEESARMRTLVEDLLLLARLDERREPARQAVDLAVLAADACTDIRSLDGARRVTLRAPAPAVVAGDEDHLRQAVGNLTANAVRHTPPGTPIEVAVAVDGGEATLAVRDHGPGLDDEALAHVFDRFWRGDAARSGSGAGLGLSIVASVTAEHGGRATATNAPGGGAVFTLHLPLPSTVGEAPGPAAAGLPVTAPASP